MKRSKSTVWWLLLSCFLVTESHALQPGQVAPPFALMDHHGHLHDLQDYRGRWVILYFYPQDDTPGCTTEACSIRDVYEKILAQNAAVLGVSLDDQASHQAFSEKHQLNFTLLSDPDGHTAKAYGALFKFGPIKMSKRHSFIIDPQGRIVKVYREVAPDAHAAQLLSDLELAQKHTMKKE